MKNLSVALLGFVNAHAHLELSGFDHAIPWDGSFVNWIAAVMKHRYALSYSREQAIQRGIDELTQTGTIAVGDIVQSIDDDSPQIPGRRFFELIGWRNDQFHERLLHAEQFLQCRDCDSFGLSPHAPYTICPELLHRAVTLSQKYKIPLAIHLAETKGELELLKNKRGPFLEMMQRIDDSYDPQKTLLGDRPLDYLKIFAEADRTVIIHGNYLDEEEINFLAAHRDRMSVVFCPVPHRYFRHEPYPLGKMLAAGVRVALGTDSRASWPSGSLSMNETVRVLLEDYPEVDIMTAHQMATVNGAIALGFEYCPGQ